MQIRNIQKSFWVKLWFLMAKLFIFAGRHFNKNVFNLQFSCFLENHLLLYNQEHVKLIGVQSNHAVEYFGGLAAPIENNLGFLDSCDFLINNNLFVVFRCRFF